MVDTSTAPSRRAFLGLAVGAGALGLSGTFSQAQAPIPTRANILILGAGAAGTALANRLVERLEGASITLVDGRPAHWYQPGFSLIAAGLKP
ncbi:MAG: pyridine nucleotide-disulfide oxidoreductase, partial [Roseobacter sp.]|nr:pyridine nucleotide-disulfide oxidoreductase [Roseobacter sp.]